MYRFPIVLLVVLFVGGSVAAQSPNDLLKDIRKIKLLESSREEVRQILYLYTASDDDDHQQTFSNAKVEIEIDYSSGSCSDDPEEDDPTEVWNVGEWKVTRIEITPSEPADSKRLGFDLSKFTKEQMYDNYAGRHIYHDKALGLGFEIDEDGVQSIAFFPRRSSLKKLCSENTEVKAFYSRDSWFSEKLEDRNSGCVHYVAHVEELTLDRSEIGASSVRTLSVTTDARDPENDVLTYNYVISGGTIKGRGANVVWDLTGVLPGTYTITAGVDDGCGICGKTVTKTVVVK